MSNENLPPSPAEVEAVAKEMLDLRGKLSEIETTAQKEAEPHEARLLELKKTAEAWLRAFGSAHAEKSKLLHGVLYEIMGTFGQSTSIDAAAVELFRLALVKAKQARLLRRIFEKTIRFDLKDNFAEVVNGTKLKPKLLALYSQCQRIVPKTPVITPRLKKKETEAA